jgi:UDP-N-acetyl-D-mannosaminuronic acid transferase (WecB/TagA/CpsF family)
MKIRFFKFYNIKFYEASYNYVINYLLKKKGYIVMPAASALQSIKNDSNYHNALQKSSIAILDSGYFCILILLLKFKKFQKFSGYKFMKNFINDKKIKSYKILILDPTTIDSRINKLYLHSKGLKFTKHYICPIYDKNLVIDKKLINLVNKFKPKFIISNIGGGNQEKLALYINNNSNWKPITLCTGAALSFFSNTNYNFKITDDLDKYYLGWLIRLLNNPSIFFIRLVYSLPLIFLFFSKKKFFYK